MAHFEKYNVLDNAQHGFRKKRSTTSQLVITVNDFASTLRDQKQTDAILLDFSKAFDKVDHEGLLLKLHHLGISGPLLNWARSFLVGREQRVVVEGMESAPSKVLSGVPQGTVLGPLFFLIYINDISKGLSKGTKIRLFADDSLLYRTIETPSDSATLQNDLNTLQLWEKKWKMEFHPGKCQLLRITNKTEPIKSTYFIHDTPISETDSAKYLGVVIDSKLKWTQQYSKLIKSCNCTLAFLKRNLPNSPFFVKNQCYISLIRPKLEYACAIWDPHSKTHIENLEKVQKRAARFVTGNYTMESGAHRFNLNLLGWPLLEERRLQTRLTLFQKARLNLIDIPTDHLAIKHRRTRQGGGGLTYHREFSKIDSYIFSFFPRTSQVWNNLPPELKSCTNLENFMKAVSTIDREEILSGITHP